MDWNNIWENTISGIFVVIFGGISAWIVYLLGIRGKEKAQIASLRKQEIYIPLKYELKGIIDMEHNIWKNIKTPEINKILENNDEFVVSKELYDKCNTLSDLVSEYNSINMYRVVADILSKRFEERYIQLYGSSTHTEFIYQEDFEGEIEATDPEITDFYETVRQKNVIDRIMNNSIDYEEYCNQKGYVSPFEEFYAILCASVLPKGENTYDGVKLKEESIIQKKKTPAEYIAYGFKFFEIYESDINVNKKENLLDSIKSISVEIFEDVSSTIRNIGNKYEKE